MKFLFDHDKNDPTLKHFVLFLLSVYNVPTVFKSYCLAGNITKLVEISKRNEYYLDFFERDNSTAKTS